jgi:23S rRNA U2552 (ribose-2'-O)-methylase RlmE/FtsJ
MAQTAETRFNYKDEHYESAPLQFVTPPRLSYLQEQFAKFNTNFPKENFELIRYRKKYKSDKVIKICQEPKFIPKPEIVFKDDWISFRKIEFGPAQKTVVGQVVLELMHKGILNAKAKVASLDELIYKRSRLASNPYEAIKKSIFINRSAVKLAEIDSVFSIAKASSGKTFYFADLCGGPGGFTEYIIWRNQKAKVQGWGITLCGEQDYDFSNSHIAKLVQESFSAEKGMDGSGNIYSMENIKHFCAKVLDTAKTGVDLCVSDGGFNVQGDESYQEIHSTQLILCQTLTALKILKKGRYI